MKRLVLLLGLLAAAAVLGSPASGGPATSSYIVVLAKGAPLNSVLAQHDALSGVTMEHTYSHALKGYAAKLSPSALSAVRADPRVAFVSPDRVVRATAQTLPTGINRIDGDTSSTASGNGSGSVNVNVAVIDTGIDSTHPDLNVVGGKDCAPGIGTMDGNGHGSHVSGTIAAKDDANGVVGVVPGARLYAVKVLNDAGVGLSSDIVCGIDWVTSTRTDGDPNNNIAAANMSLGGGGTDDGNCGRSNADAEHLAICNSVAAGVTYVVAAGNDGVDFRSTTPASYDEVLTVTAVADFNGAPGGGAASTCRSDVDDQYASFSDFAVLAADQNHTIAAPGVCIYSTYMLGMYDTLSGTSMASPHMTGTAALCIATGACTGTPAQIIAKLRGDAQSYNQANPGYGFTGDPAHPVSGRYYGYLTRAGAY
ncbi:MAG TPA: S8 family serine peptidase [Gaiellaceae bacterium]